MHEFQDKKGPNWGRVTRGCKRSFGPREQRSPRVSCTFRNLFCTGATLFCTTARGFSLPGSKRPFAPSRVHFWEFPIFDPLSQMAWFAKHVLVAPGLQVVRQSQVPKSTHSDIPHTGSQERQEPPDKMMNNSILSNLCNGLEGGGGQCACDC